jgi:hypothetical protein
MKVHQEINKWLTQLTKLCRLTDFSFAVSTAFHSKWYGTRERIEACIEHQHTSFSFRDPHDSVVTTSTADFIV